MLRRTPRAAADTSPRLVSARALATASLVVAFIWWMAAASGAVTKAQGPAPVPTPGGSFYEAQFSRTSLPEGGGLPQDITGQVLDRFGRGQGGVLVRITSPGWEAVTSTDSLGQFRFTVLDEGGFSIDLPQLRSSAAFVTVNQYSLVHIVFRERFVSPTPVPPTPTPERTPSPTATPSKPTVSIATTVAPQPSPTITPTLVAAGGPRVVSSDFNIGPLATAFFFGGGVALVLFVAGLVLVVVRR